MRAPVHIGVARVGLPELVEVVPSLLRGPGAGAGFDGNEGEGRSGVPIRTLLVVPRSPWLGGLGMPGGLVPVPGRR